MKRSPLKADPAKTAAFHQRGRAQGLKRETELRASKALGRGTPKARVSTPPDMWAAVLRRDEGLCVWARHLGQRRRAEHPHHLLSKGVWPEFVGERANVVAMSPTAHMTHEHSPNDRLPWEALPAECQEFLRRAAASDPRAARLVETKYPFADGEPVHPVRRKGV